MRAHIQFDSKDEFGILTMVEGITRMNEHYLAANPDTPGLYESDVFYQREGAPEQWFDVPNILSRGKDDCEGLASWRAAELRRLGYNAHAVLRRYDKAGGGTLYHCLVEVQTPQGPKYDDPSARLGMFTEGARDLPEGAVAGFPIESYKAMGSRSAASFRADEDETIDQAQLRTMHRLAKGRWSTDCDQRRCSHKKRRMIVISPPGALPAHKPLTVEGEIDDDLYLYLQAEAPVIEGSRVRRFERAERPYRRHDGRLVLGHIARARHR